MAPTWDLWEKDNINVCKHHSSSWKNCLESNAFFLVLYPALYTIQIQFADVISWLFSAHDISFLFHFSNQVLVITLDPEVDLNLSTFHYLFSHFLHIIFQNIK